MNQRGLSYITEPRLIPRFVSPAVSPLLINSLYTSAHQCIREFQQCYLFIYNPFCSVRLFSTCFLFYFSLFSSPSLLSWLSCDAVLAFLYFQGKTAFGCQPTVTFFEKDKCCLLCATLLFSVLGKVKQRVYSASIFSSSFEQRCFFLRFPSESDFKQAQPLAFNWTFNIVIGSGFSVQSCANLICWLFAFHSHFLRTFNHGQSFYLQEFSVPCGMFSS